MRLNKIFVVFFAILFLIMFYFNVPIYFPYFLFKNCYILIIPQYKINSNFSNPDNKKNIYNIDFYNYNYNLNNIALFISNNIDYDVIFNQLKTKNILYLYTYEGFIKIKYKNIKSINNLKNIIYNYVLTYLKENFDNKIFENLNKKKTFDLLYFNNILKFYSNKIFPDYILYNSLLLLKNFPFFCKFTILTPYFITEEENNTIKNIVKNLHKIVIIKYIFNNNGLIDSLKYLTFVDNISFNYSKINKNNYLKIIFSKNWFTNLFFNNSSLNFNKNTKINFQKYNIKITIFDKKYNLIKSSVINLQKIINDNFVVKIPLIVDYFNNNDNNNPNNILNSKNINNNFYNERYIRIQLFSKNDNSIKLSVDFKIILPEISNKNVLMITQNKKYSFFDNFIKIKKINIDNINKENLSSYNLIIFNGINIKSIDENTSNILYSLYENGLTSFLFVSNGLFIGKVKDNRLIEKIIPVILQARSLKYLPPINLTILLDISSSMLGEKLSLAKVSLLEFIKNLKETDLITIIIFWDKFRYLFRNQLKSQIIKNFNIEKIKAQGGTDLYKPLSDLINNLHFTGKMDKHIIIISDGFTKKENFNNLIYKAKLKNITITTIGIGNKINFELLSKLSSQTSGNFYQVNSFDKIPEVILEDRKKISRSNFAKNIFSIFDFNNDYVSFVKGMNLYTPKTQSISILKNQFNDPLLIYKKYKNKYQILFSSDIYGYYTSKLFNNSYVKNIFVKMFKNLSKNNKIEIKISEYYKGINISFKNQFLSSPEIIIFNKNKKIKVEKLKQQSLNYFTRNINLDKEGEYLIAINDNNRNIAKFSYWFNNNCSGIIQPYIEIYSNSKKEHFLILHNSKYWLILFFIFSICLTILNRTNIKL